MLRKSGMKALFLREKDGRANYIGILEEPRAGQESLLGLLICMVPTAVGVWFAFRPTERLLSFMRPLTLGAVFAALSNFALAIANGFVAISMMTGLDVHGVRVVGAVFMEGFGAHEKRDLPHFRCRSGRHCVIGQDARSK